MKRRFVRLKRLGHWWPWVISVGFHLVLLVGMSAIVLVTYRTEAVKPEIIPEARLGRIDSKLPLFQKINERVKQPEENTLAKNLKQQILPKEDMRLVRTALEGSEKSSETKELFEQSVKSSQVLPGGDLARLQPAAPMTRFFSSGGNAYNIVYLVDRSASMIDSIEPLKRELKQSIAVLQPMQKFHIIFFSSGQPVEGPGKELVWATDRNKLINYEFIDTIQSQGQTDPQWALQRALQMSPDLIYLLTDGVFSSEIAKKMIEWAKLHKVKINTIAYVMESGGSVLRKIAEETGGVYRFVPEEQLQ
jgi:uncharacterized protein with von Willebrand factor type A (vWA) domain